MAHERTTMRARGFTLIELMITVAIVAILASIALPAYRDSVLKGKRAQGRTALLEFAQSQERHYTANNCYLTNSTAGVADGAPPATCPFAGSFKLYSGDSATASAYKLFATTCTGTPTPTLRECVSMVAVPQAPDPAVGNLTLDSTGRKGCDATTANLKLCWP